MIVEATVVNSTEENWQTWEPILTGINYHKVWFDGLNNFYLREEDLELRHAFRLPPNIFDRFETAEVVQLKSEAAELREEAAELKQMTKELKKQIDALFSRRAFRWLTRFAKWPELMKLTEFSTNPGARH